MLGKFLWRVELKLMSRRQWISLVWTSHELAPNFSTNPGCGFSVHSNTAKGLAKKAWECKVTTAQCWNHRACGTFYYSFCGLLVVWLVLMKANLTCLGCIIVFGLTNAESHLLGYIFRGRVCFYFFHCWPLAASSNSKPFLLELQAFEQISNNHFLLTLTLEEARPVSVSSIMEQQVSTL